MPLILISVISEPLATASMYYIEEKQEKKYKNQEGRKPEEIKTPKAAKCKLDTKHLTHTKTLQQGHICLEVLQIVCSTKLPKVPQLVAYKIASGSRCTCASTGRAHHFTSSIHAPASRRADEMERATITPLQSLLVTEKCRTEIGW